MNLATLGRISFSRDNVAVQVRKYGGGGDLLAFVRLLDAEILAAASPPPESKQSPESVDWSWGNFCQQHIQGEVKFPVRSKWILRATPSTNTFYAATTNRNVSGYHPNHYLRSYTLTDYLPPQRCKVPGLTCQRLTFSTNRKARPRMENFYEDLRKPPDPGGRGDSFSIEWTTSNDPVNGGRQGLVYLAKDYCKSWERTLEQTAEGPGDLCLIDVVNKKGGNNPSSTLFFCRDNIAVRVHSWQYMDIEDARLIDECLLASPILRTVRSP